jgi:hypothetical protein
MSRNKGDDVLFVIAVILGVAVGLLATVILFAVFLF